MTKQKSNIVQAIVVGALLILTLPLVYLLFARVILPLEWDEPQFNEESGTSESD